MTKKQYFFLLWGIPSFIISLQIALFFGAGIIPLDIAETGVGELKTSTSVMMVLIGMIISIFINAFMVAIGLDFAEKLKVKLLFLDQEFDFKTDIFKPALLGGIAYTALCVLVSKWGLLYGIQMEQFAIDGKQLSTLLSGQNIQGLLLHFLEISGQIVKTLTNDIWSYLLIISGVSLFLKSIVQDLSSSDAIRWSIILRCCYQVFMALVTFGFSIFTIVPLVQVIKNILLGLLFWKKGFEAVILCHLIIIVLLYIVTPHLVIVFGV